MLAEKQKDIIINKIKETGRLALAARWAETTQKNVENYYSVSPDFKRACLLAQEMYIDFVVKSIRGWEDVVSDNEVKYDRQGNRKPGTILQWEEKMSLAPCPNYELEEGAISKRLQYESSLREKLSKS